MTQQKARCCWQRRLLLVWQRRLTPSNLILVADDQRHLPRGRPLHTSHPHRAWRRRECLHHTCLHHAWPRRKWRHVWRNRVCSRAWRRLT